MSNNNAQGIGIIYNGEFYEILINKKSTKFKENIRPQEARLPKELKFPAEDEKKLVFVSYNSNGNGQTPIILEKSNQLPENAIKMLVEYSIDSSRPFLPSTVGGSVNLDK
ncbi:hypothetical protein [Priestia megaterium]|uniref:hypothetical protein n=1 Tax=Priestia megaterium TaxID=1404 RepID=UPI0023DBC5C2|nr:hypothetical protein [Priestia megaterium]MDF2014665.1 hypothetical protein [Priestia megaterium]